MTDTISTETRSKVMASVHSSGNKATELKLIRIMRKKHIKGWRRHQRLPGNPDFVFRKERLCIFVDGCFWHGCKTHCRMPKSHQEYWNTKIDNNRKRDRRINQLLRANGWEVFRIWEHSLNEHIRVASTIKRAFLKRRLINEQNKLPHR
jgi:DNA mismatch endonuclease, patch repair protein